jgi:hypothetical protein
MAQFRRQGLTGMPPLPWSTGQPAARGVGGTVEPAPDLATTCREPAPDPIATSHSPLERQGGGGGHPTPEPDSTRWESTVDSISGRHHVVLTAKTPRGGGECHLSPEPATTCRERATNVRSGHRHATPTAESPSTPRHHGAPLQPGQPPHEGWTKAPLPPSSPTPRVVLVVYSGGSTAPGCARDGGGGG